MDVASKVQELLMEVEYLERTLDVLEIGLENCGYSDNKSAVSSVHVINKYLEMLKKDFIEKLTSDN